MQFQIAPSMLSADFLHLEKDVRMVNESADIFHLDIMDGTFVPNISFGFSVVDALGPAAVKPMDAHLMIVNPDKYFEKFAADGVSMLSFHLETSITEGKDPSVQLRRIKELGMKAGLAINPDMPVEKVFPYLKEADFILVMSVFAGFGGQKFIPESLNRIRAIKAEAANQGAHCLIEVDGGVNIDNVKDIVEAGADILVAGSAVFRSENPAAAIEAMRRV